MPKVDNVGYGDCTEKKMEDYSKIIGMHLAITQAVLKKFSHLYPQHYYYIDLTAGKGYSPTGVKGSPIVFLEQAEKRKFALPYSADFIECEPKNMVELKENIEKEKRINGWVTPYINFHLGKYQDEIQKLFSKKSNKEFGLVFVDPSGDMPDFNVLHFIAVMRPKMEILIYLPSTNVKRTYQYTEKRLTDYIGSIGKKYWLIRKPISWDQFKWTFLLGSNAPSLFPDYKDIDFFQLESEKGQKILEALNLTEKEQMESKQFRLF
jgi:three-Cys-motif partner protein